MTLYKIKNKTKEVRKFLDNNTGKYIFVNPKSEVTTNQKQEESDIWSVSIVEESKNNEKETHHIVKKEDKK